MHIKSISIILIAFFVTSHSIRAQGLDINIESQRILNLIDSLKSPIYTSKSGKKDSLLVNASTLNTYFNSRVSSFLTGAENLSLYKNYAIANSEDDRLFIGRTLTQKDPSDHITNLFTAGLHMDIDKGFAKVVDDASVQNNIGISGRITVFTKGYLNYVKKGKELTQVQKIGPSSTGREIVDHFLNMKNSRVFIAEQVRHTYMKSLENFLSQYDKLRKKKIATSILNEFVSDFFKEQKNTVIASFVEKELEALKDDGNFTQATKSWVSVFAYVPFTISEYTVAQNLTSVIGKKSYYPWELSISSNFFRETKGKFDLYGFIKAGIFNTNSVELEDISKLNISEYRPLGGTDTLKLATLSSDEIYVGDFENSTGAKVSGQIGILFHSKKSTKFGLNLELEHIAVSDYHITNLDFGIPISLKGQKKDVPVNLEPILRIIDLTGNETDDELSKRITIGFALGLPFGNTIYK